MTLTELLVVLAILGISVTAATQNLRPLETPLQTGASLVQGMFRQARLRAIASTSAYRVSPAGSQILIAETAASCAETTWTSDPDVLVEMPDDVTMSPTSWTVCFSGRGLSTNNVTVTLNHPYYGTREIEVLLGGTTRVIE